MSGLTTNSEVPPDLKTRNMILYVTNGDEIDKFQLSNSKDKVELPVPFSSDIRPVTDVRLSKSFRSFITLSALTN